MPYDWLNASVWEDWPVLGPLSPEDLHSQRSRYTVMRMSAREETMVSYWTAWVFISFMSAASSAFVIALILARPRLRHKMWNQFIVGLAVPDFLFSSACGHTCLLSALHHGYYGGPSMCQWQALYAMFGFTASIWMNVVVSHELHRLAMCTKAARTYKPHSIGRTWVIISIVYIYSLLLSFSTIWFGLPIMPGSHRGLACLPMASSARSELFFWSIFMPLLFTLPLVISVVLLYRVHRVVMKVMIRRNQFSSITGRVSVKSLSGARGGGVSPGGRTRVLLPVVTGILRRLSSSSRFATSRSRLYANRDLLKFFARLFIVFVFMWLPCMVFIWLVVTESEAFAYIGGSISHLQGLVSALLYLAKSDIKFELMQLASCNRRYPCRRTDDRKTDDSTLSEERHRDSTTSTEYVIRSSSSSDT